MALVHGFGLWGKGRKRLEFLGGSPQGVDPEPREGKFFWGIIPVVFLAGGHIGGKSDGEVRLGYGKLGRSLTLSYQSGN